jgi:hypothetical protein
MKNMQGVMLNLINFSNNPFNIQTTSYRANFSLTILKFYKNKSQRKVLIHFIIVTLCTAYDTTYKNKSQRKVLIHFIIVTLCTAYDTTLSSHFTKHCQMHPHKLIRRPLGNGRQ